MIDWKVGDKVVCVGKFVDTPEVGEVFPEVGIVYTIRTIGAGDDDDVFIRLDEVVNPMIYDDTAREIRFWVRRFRKVQPSAIKVFTDMLTTTPKTVDSTIDA